MASKKYPAWKKVLWRYGRVFIASFLGGLAIDQLFVGSSDAWLALGKSALIAGIVAVAKALRNEFPENTKLQKLPV